MKRPSVAAALAAIALLPAQGLAQPAPDPGVRAVVIPGTGYPPAPVLPAAQPRAGDVSLNFPDVEVRDLAKAVLGDILGLPYAVAASARGSVNLVTGAPIARQDVLPTLEEALRSSGFALSVAGGTYTIAPLAEARGSAPLAGPTQSGFGTEVLQLQFVGAAALKRLIDPILPGVVTGVDEAANRMTVAGTTGQRRSVRDLARQFDVDWLRGMSFALFTPQRTDARLITPELDRLINAPQALTAGLVRLVAMDRLNGILAISAQAQFLEDVRRWVEVLDREGESAQPRLYVYPVQNGRAADLSKVLVASLGGGAAAPGAPPAGAGSTGGFGGAAAAAGDGDASGLGRRTPAPPPAQASGQPGQAQSQSVDMGDGGRAATITSDEVNNAVVVFGTPRQYAVILEALRKLDVTPMQVLIEAAITEVTLNDKLNYGVQWLFSNAESQFSLSQGDSPTPTRIFPGFSYLFANGRSITATLNALSDLTKINVLSAPKLMVLNNHTASLQVGDQVPVTTQSATSIIGDNAPLVNSIQYRPTGVILTVTPRVNSGGLVLLDISQEVSDVTPNQTSGIDSPTIQERRVATSIAIQDGQTVALGGLILDRNTRGRAGLPLLNSVPVLGALAGNRRTTRDRTELLILLTPRVIRTADDARAITDDLREKIRSVEPLGRGKP